MTKYPRIHYRIRSDEFRELYPAFLIDEETAIELTEYGVLNMFGVIPDKPAGVYIDTTGTISLGVTENEDDIALVVDRLRNMTAWELVVRFMTRSSQPFEFDLVNMKVVDPAPSTLLGDP